MEIHCNTHFPDGRRLFIDGRVPTWIEPSVRNPGDLRTVDKNVIIHSIDGRKKSSFEIPGYDVTIARGGMYSEQWKTRDGSIHHEHIVLPSQIEMSDMDIIAHACRAAELEGVGDVLIEELSSIRLQRYHVILEMNPTQSLHIHMQSPKQPYFMIKPGDDDSYMVDALEPDPKQQAFLDQWRITKTDQGILITVKNLIGVPINMDQSLVPFTTFTINRGSFTAAMTDLHDLLASGEYDEAAVRHIVDAHTTWAIEDY